MNVPDKMIASMAREMAGNRDASSHAGAIELCKIIEKRGADCGYDVRCTVERVVNPKGGDKDWWAVRSDMVNGMPVRRWPKAAAA